MVSVVLYPEEIRILLREPSGLVYPYIEKKAKQIVRLAKAQVGVDTGALKASIGYTIRGGQPVDAKITASNKIAMIHHEGTQPHIIKPKNGKALRVGNRGTIVVTRVVHHPGTKPNKFFADPLRAVF